MKLVWHDDAWDDYLWWQANDRSVVRRINRLVKEIGRDPSGGIGKPEILKEDLSGWLSRRINGEHRLVYRVRGDALEIAQCRYHYAK